MTADSVVLYIRFTASATVQSLHVHAHIVCVYFLCRPTEAYFDSKQCLGDISALSKVG